tara:strand:- start:786 stop:1136 length:351 start_codon:yes stop_codon:yes gene_type:complete
MSCGQNHKFDAYQKASDALKDALVAALNNDEETSTLNDLWQHYMGAREIADKASNSFSIHGGDFINFGDGITAGTVELDYSTGLGTANISTVGVGSETYNVADFTATEGVDNITFA